MGAVKSAAKSIGSAVSDVVGGAKDIVNNTVKSVEKNPVQAVTDIALIASGNGYLVPYANTGIGIAQGQDPAKAITSGLVAYGAGQIGNEIGANVADATDSSMAGKMAGSATSGATRALVQGRDPFTSALAGAINTGANAELADASGLSYLPKFDVASELLGTQSAPTRSALPRTALASSRALPQASTSAADLPTLGMSNLQLPTLGIPNLELPKLGLASADNSQISSPTTLSKPASTKMAMADLPQIYSSIGQTYASGGSAKIDNYKQIYSSIVPPEELSVNGKLVTPQQEYLMGEDPAIMHADGGHVEHIMSQLIPEMRKILMAHHAEGGLAEFEKNTTPTFAKPQQPSVIRPEGGRNQFKLAQIAQMSQGPLSQNQLRMHAKGGLSKYEEAAPEGHHPEFITGVTGYYAGGRGTGQSDDIPAMLHDGDHVADADVVAALGDGSSKAGKEVLDKFRKSIPHKNVPSSEPVPAMIADGEYVMPESFVTALGQGDNKRGAKLLDIMREELRKHKRSAPDSKIPPKALSPMQYIERGIKKTGNLQVIHASKNLSKGNKHYG